MGWAGDSRDSSAAGPSSKLSPPRLKLPNCIPTFSTPVPPRLPKLPTLAFAKPAEPNTELGITTGWSTFLYRALLLWDTGAGLEGAVLAACAGCTTGEACAGGSGVGSGTAAETAITGSESSATSATSGSGTRGSSLTEGGVGLDTDGGSSSQTGACAVVGSSHPEDDASGSEGASVGAEGVDMEGAGSGACAGGGAGAGVGFSCGL